MADWTGWQDLEEEVLDNDDATETRGVYRIRIVNPQGTPIPISRLGGVDKESIYYIGSAGESIRSRLRAFYYYVDGPSPAGNLYEDIQETLDEVPGFEGHRFQYQVKAYDDKDLPNQMEGIYLEIYLNKFCELPPGNSRREISAAEALLRRTDLA